MSERENGRSEEEVSEVMEDRLLKMDHGGHSCKTFAVSLSEGALGGPGGSGWGGRWEGGSGWGRHVNPRPFHFNV